MGDITWGSMKTFYPDGKLKSESTRFNTKTIGYSRSYGSDGKLIYEQYRDNDGALAYQDYYASNGKLRLAVDYWPGEKEKDRYDYGNDGGPLQNYYEYDQAGSLKLKEVWSNGKLVSSTPQ
jgi:antitoxin component YwqK of YwqJK toxin-antitoxin module